MQFQGSLLELGHARLALFETFCLPTMRQQSSQRFLWLIKTDPKLDSSLLTALVDLVKPYPNFYVVASNNNFVGKWRAGNNPRDLARSKVYTGDQALLERAMALKDQRIVLETRLDADDGLYVNFTNELEKKALEILEPTLTLETNTTTTTTSTTATPLKWMYWCVKRHLEWHWTRTGSHGTLSVLNAHYCVTPGLTVGMAVGQDNAKVPNFSHFKLAAEMRRRHLSQHLHFLLNESYAAIRPRTPTSAGQARMKNNANGNSAAAEEQQLLYWNDLDGMFGLNSEAIGSLHEYVTRHLVDIAKDNLKGECHFGCQKSAKADLQKLINRHSNTSKP
jgi:hypothetical protein